MPSEQPLTLADGQVADIAAPRSASREDARLRKLFEDVRDLAVAAMQRAYNSHTQTMARSHMKQSYILQEAAGVIEKLARQEASGG